MAYFNEEKMIRLIAKYANYTISAVRELRDAEVEVTKQLLKEGHKIAYGNLGRFRLKEHESKAGRDYKLPKTGEMIYLEPKPAYQSPEFYFLKEFKDEVRELTEDNLV